MGQDRNKTRLFLRVTVGQGLPWLPCNRTPHLMAPNFSFMAHSLERIQLHSFAGRDIGSQ
jgi:hypothetical protein